MADDVPPAASIWQPSWAVVGGTAAAAVLLVVAGVLLDVPGALLAWAAAAVTAGFAAYDAAARPALVADATGLTVRSGWRPRQVRWASVRRIEVTETRRLLVLHALEVDTDDELLLFPRRRLGADLAEVADRLRTYRDASLG